MSQDPVESVGYVHASTHRG